MPAEDPPNDSQSVDSRDLEADGSDAEGEDLQKNAERFVCQTATCLLCQDLLQGWLACRACVARLSYLLPPLSVLIP